MNTKVRWFRLLNLVTVLALLLPSTGTPAAAQVQLDLAHGIPPALAVADSTSDQTQAWAVSQHPPTGDAENVEFVGHVGGATYAVVVQGDYAYVGEGPKLSILDVSNPASLSVVGKTLPLPGIVRGVTIAGNYVYVNAGEAGMRVVDVSAPSNPTEVGFYDTPSGVKGVAVAGDYAYVASGQLGLRIVDISTPSKPAEVGFYDTPGSAESVAVSGGYAYIADGNEGLRVVDISAPTNPVEVGNALEAVWGSVIVAGNYAYVANRVGLQVVDITAPDNPRKVGSYDTPGNARDVTIAGNYAYIADEDGGLRVVDISTPSNPTEVGLYNAPGNTLSVTIANKYAYVAAGSNGLRVVDISTPSNPRELGFYDTPGIVSAVTIASDFAYLAAGSDGLRVVDVSIPADPKEVGFYNTPGGVGNIVVAGGYAYVASGEGGMRIVDVSTPTNPREVSFYDTPGFTRDVDVAGGYAYIADYSYDSYYYGLQIMDISTPSNPRKVGYYKAPGEVKAVTIAGDYAYVANYGWGVRVVDVSIPHNPIEVGAFSSGGWAVDIAVAGSYAYVAARENSLQVVDVSTPYSPREMGDVLSLATGVAVDQGLAYVVNGGFALLRTGLRVVDVSTPSNSKEVGFYDTPGSASSVAVAGDYIYVADVIGGLLILRYTGEEGRVEPPIDAPTPTVVPTLETEPATSVAPLISFELRDSREWIAFVGVDRNIWLVHPDGTELQQVTTDADAYDKYSDPKWSPTGESLAFIRYDSSSNIHSLMIFEIGTFELVTLISDTAGGFDWSPDGSQIAYDKPYKVVTEQDPFPHLEWGDYDGLWMFDLLSGQDSLLVAPDLENPLSDPHWSPDGKHIAFVEWYLGGADAAPGFCVAELGDSGPYKALSVFSLNGAWSPDGVQLACADLPPMGLESCSFFIFDYRGSSVVELPAEENTCNLNPLWSPDSRYIAVVARVGGQPVGGPMAAVYTPSESFVDILTPDGTERRRIASGAPVGWSPDSRLLLIVDEKTISAVEIDTGATTIIGEGYDADWQPQPMLPLSLDDLAVAKQAVIPRLEQTHYEYVYNSAQVPIDAYDEDAAIELLAELGQTDPTPEQLAALSRLVLQEQALAETLGYYSILSNDQADIVVDVVGMSVGTIFLLGGAKVDSHGALRGLAEKIVADYLKLVAGSIPDEQARELTRDSVSLAMGVISSRTGDPEAFVQALLEEQVRAMVAERNINALVHHVQPSIDQGVRSVAGSSDDEMWMVEGTDAMASFQTDHISTTSQLRQETAHSQYQQLAEGLVVNEFLRDIADLVTIGTGFLPIPTILSLWTRFQQCIVDAIALSYVGNGMACIRQVSERAGELSFHPQQQLARCQDPTDPILVQWLDSAAWLNLQPRLENDLTSYADAVQAVQVAIQNGDLTQVQEAADQLTVAQSNLNTSSTVALALLAPPVGETWSPATGTIAQQIVNFELDMVGLQIGLAGYLDQPDSQDAQDFVNLYTQRLLEGAVEGQALDSWRVFLPLVARTTGSAETETVSKPSVKLSDAASLLENVTRFGQMLESEAFETNAVPVPLIANIPTELATIVGQQVTVAVDIQNAGSATLTEATLTASAHDTVLGSLNVPSIDAGGSAELTLSFTLSAEGRSVILLELDDGARTDFRFIPLTVQAVPAQLTPTPAVEGEASDLPESRQAGFSNRLPVAIIILVVAILVTILSAIALRRFRPANRSLALLIGLGGPVVILLAAVILWQVGPLQKWVGSSTAPPPTPDLATPTGETIAATVSSPIRTPTSPSISGQSPIATPTPETYTPTPATESLAGCPGAPEQQVQVGDRARVCTAYDRLAVRAQPRTDSTEITRLEPGIYVTIVDGPTCAESWSWWKIQTDSGTVGWVTEGGDDVDPYFICPVR